MPLGDLESGLGIQKGDNPFTKDMTWKEWDDFKQARERLIPTMLPNIADKAVDLVLGPRNSDYGNPSEDYGKTAKVWSGLLLHKLKEGVEITPKEAVLMMAALKLSREMHAHKQDNLVDAIGYVLLTEWIETGIKPTN